MTQHRPTRIRRPMMLRMRRMLTMVKTAMPATNGAKVRRMGRKRAIRSTSCSMPPRPATLQHRTQPTRSSTRNSSVVRAGKARYREIARGQIIGDTTGLLKLIFHSESRALLGVHIIGAGAGDAGHHLATGQPHLHDLPQLNRRDELNARLDHPLVPSTQAASVTNTSAVP